MGAVDGNRVIISNEQEKKKGKKYVYMFQSCENTTLAVAILFLAFCVCDVINKAGI